MIMGFIAKSSVIYNYVVGNYMWNNSDLRRIAYKYKFWTIIINTASLSSQVIKGNEILQVSSPIPSCFKNI